MFKHHFQNINLKFYKNKEIRNIIKKNNAWNFIWKNVLVIIVITFGLIPGTFNRSCTMSVFPFSTAMLKNVVFINININFIKKKRILRISLKIYI